jgi:hypothetical protein
MSYGREDSNADKEDSHNKDKGNSNNKEKEDLNKDNYKKRTNPESNERCYAERCIKDESKSSEKHDNNKGHEKKDDSKDHHSKDHHSKEEVVHERGKERQTEESPTTSQSKPKENPVLFDSLVENEKTFLKNKLKCSLYENFYESSNPCLNFYRWLVSQFKKMKNQEASSTLISNLEFLLENCCNKKGKPTDNSNFSDLFTKGGDSGKMEKYSLNIQSANLEDYSNKELDVYALAYACKNEIKTNLKFFSKDLEAKLIETNNKEAIEKAPFLMAHRNVFKLVKELIFKLDQNNSVEFNRSLNVWADIICKFEVVKEKKVEILKKLLETEFNYVPNSYYN